MNGDESKLSKDATAATVPLLCLTVILMNYR